jgi:hypothetical protein
MSSDLSPLVATYALGQIDASGPEEKPVFSHSKAVRILGVRLLDTAAKSAHADNKGTYSLINKGSDASGTDVVATRIGDTPTTDDIAAYVPWPLTLNTDETTLEIDAGEVLSFKAEEAGTAGSGDLTDALLVIEYAIGYGGGI